MHRVQLRPLRQSWGYFSSMKSAILILLAVFTLLAGTIHSASVYVLHDTTVAQATYAVRKVSKAVQRQGHDVLTERQGYDFMISLARRTGGRCPRRNWPSCSKISATSTRGIIKPTSRE